MYETDDNLTKIQMEAFVALIEANVGTDYEINESPSGEPDQYYVFVVDLEEDFEYEYCKYAEQFVKEMKDASSINIEKH
jgi:hypothetical protein